VLRLVACAYWPLSCANIDVGDVAILLGDDIVFVARAGHRIPGCFCDACSCFSCGKAVWYVATICAGAGQNVAVAVYGHYQRINTSMCKGHFTPPCLGCYKYILAKLLCQFSVLLRIFLLLGKNKNNKTCFLCFVDLLVANQILV